ncbi:lactate racemase domain-containing protein [Candidatus Neomarinimicrobiota bacterium]
MPDIVIPNIEALIPAGSPLPVMYRVQQRQEATSIEDVAGAVSQELSRCRLEERIRPGQTVAVVVGSRGIHDLAAIVSSATRYLNELGLKPFIIPAMGSHGGATAEGQVRVLSELGITESAVGAPIVSSMDTVSLGHLASGAEVYCFRAILEANHLVVINRVKPHTIVRGDVGSGLCKMLAVGCGGQQGAINMHKFDLAASIVPAARLILEQAPMLCGLAVVENASGSTHAIKAVLPDEFVDVDKELLREAKRLLPRIPLDDLDILVVDEMGKNISGAGIDPNVVGFWRRGEGSPRRPDYRTLIVLNLTAESYGNAMAIGMADLTTRRVVEKIDLTATYTNALASGILSGARLPIALENDRAALVTALCQVPAPERVRMVRIVNTLSLETFWATEAVLPELRAQEGITVDERPLVLEFDKEGRLSAF